MKVQKNEILAFALTPIASTLLLSIMGFLLTPKHRADGTAVWAFGMYFIFSVIGTAVFGLPLYLLGKKLDLVRWWSALVAGAVVGLAMIFAISGGDLAAQAQAIAPFMAIGACVGFAFWLIWQTGRSVRQ